MIAEGLALIDKAIRHRRRGPYQVQAAIAALHARAARPRDTDWAQIDLLYAALELLQPSPVVTLNRAVAVSKVRGPAGGAGDDRAAGARGWPAISISSACSGALLMQLGRAAEARAAFDQAIALADTPAQAAHIRQHLDQLAEDTCGRTSSAPAVPFGWLLGDTARGSVPAGIGALTSTTGSGPALAREGAVATLLSLARHMNDAKLDERR